MSEVTHGPDLATAAAFWARYLEATGDDPEPAYGDVERFGDSEKLADDLIALVLGGRKRATAGSVAVYEAEGETLPAVGDRWIACDGRFRPRAVLRTTEIRVGPLSSVDDAFAWDEGEGDRTRASWLADHTAYFTRTHAAWGIPFHGDIPVVFERFEVRYEEP